MSEKSHDDNPIVEGAQIHEEILEEGLASGFGVFGTPGGESKPSDDDEEKAKD